MSGCWGKNCPLTLFSSEYCENCCHDHSAQLVTGTSHKEKCNIPSNSGEQNWSSWNHWNSQSNMWGVLSLCYTLDNLGDSGSNTCLKVLKNTFATGDINLTVKIQS